MAKVHFEMDFDVVHQDAEYDDIWTLSFYYDTDESIIEFLSVVGSSTVTHDWQDFLKLINKEADGTFVDYVYKLAESYVELNLDGADEDFEE